MLFRSQKAASLIQVMLAAGMVAGIALVVGSFVTDSSRVSMRISAGDQCQLTLASIMNNLKSNDNSLLDANRMSYLPVAGALDPEAVLNPSGAAEDWYRFSMGANAGLDTQQTYPIVRTCSGVNLNDNLICPVRRFAQDGSTSITTPLATVNQQLLSLARYTNTWQLLRTPAVRASMIYNTNAAYCAGGVQINAGAAGINSLWAAALNNVGLGNLTNPVVTMQIQRMRADGSVNCNGAGSGTAGIIPITGNANRTSAQNAF